MVGLSYHSPIPNYLRLHLWKTILHTLSMGLHFQVFKCVLSNGFPTFFLLLFSESVIMAKTVKLIDYFFTEKVKAQLTL